MKNFFDNQRILSVIWNRKFHFIIIGIIAFVLAFIFSLPVFIQPKFKSNARIYPSNLFELSEESRTEQMMEILSSRDIKFQVIEAFGLDTVYEIDKEDPMYNTYMLMEYDVNVSMNKTKFETVEIAVLDKDRQRASDMCDSIIHFYNQKVKELHSLKVFEVVKLSEEMLNRKSHELDSLLIRVNDLRTQTGILNFNAQVKEVTRGYMTALANNRGTSSDTKEIKKIYSNLQKFGADSYVTEKRMAKTLSVVDSLKFLHEELLIEANKNITYSHVVEYPVPAEKKAYPVRWLIALATVASAVFVALLIFLVLDYRKEE